MYQRRPCSTGGPNSATAMQHLANGQSKPEHTNTARGHESPSCGSEGVSGVPSSHPTLLLSSPSLL